MLIVGEEILKQNLLVDADRSHIKNSSYYLTIGAIIPVGEEAKNFDFNKPPEMLVIKPRQVAWVVSKEVFSIKSHEITALVTLRSTFTKKGLLALDVGMVDADFEGPIGSIVINFSKNDVPLSTGDEFFRVAFIKHAEVPAEFRPKRDQVTAAQYIKQRHNDIIVGFPATFLNTEVLSDEMAEKISQKVKDNILDQALLHIVKSHWLTLIGLIGFTVLAAVLAAYLLYSQFGPNLSQKDVQSIVKTWFEQNLPRPLPPKQ
jgi:deoxycytidine triphosphate deaminase